MAKHLMFSIYDSKVVSFARPFFAKNIAEAIRILRDFLSSSDSLPALHPEDFSLFFVGEFDDEHGLLGASSPGPINHGPLTQFVPEKPELPLLKAMEGGRK